MITQHDNKTKTGQDQEQQMIRLIINYFFSSYIVELSPNILTVISNLVFISFQKRSILFKRNIIRSIRRQKITKFLTAVVTLQLQIRKIPILRTLDLVMIEIERHLRFLIHSIKLHLIYLIDRI